MQDITLVTLNLFPKCYPILQPFGREEEEYLGLMACSFCAVSVGSCGVGHSEAWQADLLSARASLVVISGLCQTFPFLSRISSCFLLADNMPGYFPIFSYVKWRELSRKMLADEGGRCLQEAGGQAGPLQWLERWKGNQKAVSERQGAQRWQWRGCQGLIPHGISKGLLEAQQNNLKGKDHVGN